MRLPYCTFGEANLELGSHGFHYSPGKGSSPHTLTHTPTHTHTHTLTHKHTLTHTHTHTLSHTLTHTHTHTLCHCPVCPHTAPKQQGVWRSTSEAPRQC